MIQLRHALLCATVLGLVACGDDPNDPSNGNDEPVRIEYLGQSGGFDGVEFVFHRADGTIVSTQALATVKAPTLVSERLPRDGMVSIILRRGDRLDLQTVAGLQPGDRLVLGERAGEPNDVVGTLELTVDEPVGSNVTIYTPCGLTGGVQYPWLNAIRQRCLDRDDEYSVLLFANNGQRNVAYTYATDIVVNGTGRTTVDLTGSWRDDWQPFRLETPDLPPTTTDITAHVSGIHDGRHVGAFGQHSLSNASKATSFDFEFPRGCADELHVQVGYFDGADGRYYETRVPLDEQTSQHVTSTTPPRVSALELDMSTPDRPHFQWQAESEASQADNYLLYVSWEDGQGNPHNWIVYLDPRETDIRLPELPEAYVTAWSNLPYTPTAELELHADSTVGGYSDFRQNYIPGGGFDATTGPAEYSMSYTGLPEALESR